MYTLYIGNKNYSSWSLRAWVLLRALDIPFVEKRIALYRSDSPGRLREVSPSGRIPCLHDGEVIVWDSLSIVEYLAERHAGVWPADPTARAWARSAAAEMHSGFARLRDEMGMNVRLRLRKSPSPEVAAEIAHILALWVQGRERFGRGGAFLCGAFGAADAFWCPVAFRFQTYGVALAGVASAYCASLLALPAMREWATDAAHETERIPGFDPPELQAQQ
ncbi:MAG TPA: glutathione S-transferase family protein [Casimicrobiaceae bacterium]